MTMNLPTAKRQHIFSFASPFSAASLHLFFPIHFRPLYLQMRPPRIAFMRLM